MDTKRFSAKLRNKHYREAFVGAEIDFALPAQVRALRAMRGWTQAELAEKAGMKQARISAIEHAKKGSLNLATLQRLASAFDVALLVRFARFSEFAEWVATFSPDTFAVPSFDEEGRIELRQQAIADQPDLAAVQQTAARPDFCLMDVRQVLYHIGVETAVVREETETVGGALMRPQRTHFLNQQLATSTPLQQNPQGLERINA